MNRQQTTKLWLALQSSLILVQIVPFFKKGKKIEVKEQVVVIYDFKLLIKRIK